MRKKSARTPRLIAKPLPPNQLQRMIVGPRMHLQMLLSQSYDLHYAGSIGWIFNIAGTLAHFKGHVQLQAEFDAAQDVLAKLIEGGRPPNQEEANLLQKAFNLADQWIGSQDTAILTRTINHTNKAMALLQQAHDAAKCGQ